MLLVDSRVGAYLRSAAVVFAFSFYANSFIFGALGTLLWFFLVTLPTSTRWFILCNTLPHGWAGCTQSVASSLFLHVVLLQEWSALRWTWSMKWIG